jgi:glycosyltransferase involved in cell wall biosynthesis
VNILLIHQHFNTPQTGGAIRSYYLATALVSKGHRVTVITSCACKEGRRETLEGIEIVYLPIPYNNRFNFLARSRAFVQFVWAAIRAAKPYRNHDVCYAISVPLTVGLCARWLKWRYGMPYWFEVGDLWPDAPIELGYVRNRLFQWLLYKFEAYVYRHALGVVALSDPIRSAIMAKSPGSKVVLIPNMADCNYYVPEFREPKGQFVIAYVGALGVANGLHHLLACAKEAQQANLPIKIVVCGDGAMLETLKEEASALALTNVSFTGFVNRAGVRDVLQEADAVFVSYLPASILETGCPNKYFDGLAAGKLILVNFSGWIRNEIEREGCGAFVDQQQPHAFVDKLLPYLNDHEHLRKAQQAARLLAERYYSRTLIGERFASLFNS